MTTTKEMIISQILNIYFANANLVLNIVYAFYPHQLI
jgi:hypothetical protein